LGDIDTSRVVSFFKGFRRLPGTEGEVLLVPRMPSSEINEMNDGAIRVAAGTKGVRRIFLS